MTNTTVSGNSASTGGGIFNSSVTISGGTLTMSNSTVSSNVASGKGGGIYNTTILTMTNTTVSDNSAVEGGGIVDTAALFGGSHIARLTNTYYICRAL